MMRHENGSHDGMHYCFTMSPNPNSLIKVPSLRTRNFSLVWFLSHLLFSEPFFCVFSLGRIFPKFDLELLNFGG